MAKYLIKASYSKEGTMGLLKQGGSSRKAAVEKALQGLGGKLECFYFAFGDADAFVIVDLPDAITAAALSLTVNASGAVQTKTIPLLTPEDIDAAGKKSVAYRAPGA